MAVLRGLSKIPSGLDFSARFYSLLKGGLRIAKGALLLPDRRGELFLPWATTGFDRTTEHRLRLPSALVAELLSAKTPPIQILSGKALERLAPYLSSREAGLVGRLILCGFTAEETLVGLLVVAEGPYNRTNETVIRLMLTAISEAASPILASARDFLRGLTDDPPTSHLDAFRGRASDLFDRSQLEALPFVLCRLDLRPLVDQVASAAPDANQYRIRQDFLAVVGTLLHGSPLYSDDVHVFFARASQGERPELLMHQLRSALKRLFRELESVDALPYDLYVYPDDGNSFAELFAKLSP